MGERRHHCAICCRATSQDWVLGAWRCLVCGARADGREENGTVWVVLSSPSGEDVKDAWVEGVFSRADKAVDYMRGRLDADYYWAEWHSVDRAS